MKQSCDKEILKLPKEELDEPITQVNHNKQIDEVTLDYKENKIDRAVFTTIKGHSVLNWCIGLMAVIYLIERFYGGGEISNIGNVFVEVLKMLIFSLVGYLFGKDSLNK